MKFLVADTFYQAFLRHVYAARPGLTDADYATQLQAVLGAGFGHSEAYSTALRLLGHEVTDVVLNGEHLQRAWSHEGGSISSPARTNDDSWYLRVFEEQVRRAAPDVLYVHDITYLPADFVHHLRSLVPRIVAQTACPVDFRKDHTGYDLVITSFPHFVHRFREIGVAAEYLPLAFDQRALERVTASARDLNVTFVGGLTRGHHSGIEVLEEVAASVGVDVWGYGADELSPASPLLPRYRGTAWGWEMYEVLARSRVTLNRHVAVAAGSANNMRLFEATGMGAALLTDAKRNLTDLFADGQVLTYSSGAEAAEIARYLIDNPAESARIAAAGKARTLEDHTYAVRIPQLLDVLAEHEANRETTSGNSRWVPPRPTLARTVRTRLARSKAGPLLLRARDRMTGQKLASDVSVGHVVIDAGEGRTSALARGWQDPSIPRLQRNLVEGELANMRAGRPPRVYTVAANALRAAGLRDPSVLEIGCASGYYSEVFRHMVDAHLRYTGVDYSSALIGEARATYSDVPFAVADGSRLPFRDEAFDVAISGCVLLHMPEYAASIRETFRVTASHAIFHRTPVVATGDTTWLRKRAYGVEVVELVFNEDELRALFAASGAEVAMTWEVERHQLPGIAEAVRVVTYLCRVDRKSAGLQP